jgi:beta-barrel assembly-enhancing protease
MGTSNRRDFLTFLGQATMTGVFAAPLLSLLTGCKTGELVAGFGMATGVLDESQAQSLTRAGGAIAHSFEDFTPEQEYYVGRTVGAMLLSQYKPYPNDAANAYLNLVGALVSLSSDMPETFGGYRFLLLDSEEVNAFAAPGGLVLLTRGMLQCCTSEDAAAAVLAHEVGHIQYRHGLQAIKKSRTTSALSILASEGAKTLGDKELAQLTQAFEESVSDVISTLVTNGYSRSFEREADKAAVTILQRTGYDPHALVDVLRVMEGKLKPGGLDFAKTHPSPASRINDIQALLPKDRPAIPDGRRQRFVQDLQKV